MLDARISTSIEKADDGSDRIIRYHFIVFTPNDCIPQEGDDWLTGVPDWVKSSLMISKHVTIEADHYYGLLITMDASHDSIERWCLTHICEEENTIISVGISKELLDQEVKRLVTEGYTGYSVAETSCMFPEYKFKFV